MIKEYYLRLKRVFSLRFLGFLLFSQLFVKGTVVLIASSLLMPIFKNMNMDAIHVQLYITLSMSPWSIKPVIGVISDVVSIGGYHKKYYILQSIVVGVGVSIGLVFIPHSPSYSLLIVVCFFGLHYESSIVDLLSEGTYARLMRENPESGTDIVTLVNAFQTVGELLGLAFVGPLTDIDLFYPMFIIAGVFCFTPFIPTCLNWLPESVSSERATDSGPAGRTPCVAIDRPFVSQNKFPLLVVILTGLSGPVLALLTIYVNHLVGIICAFIMMSLSIAGAYSVFPLLVGHVALYLVIVQLGKPSLNSAMDFFYTANDACLQNGPGFTFDYYITYTGIISAGVSLFSVLLYQKFMSNWKFRNVLIFTSILVGLGGLTDLIIVLRLNVSAGVPDKAFYIFGNAIIENTVRMLYWIPSSAIISKVCPKNMEATTYAFLAGISNFGSMTSSMLGALIFKTAGITTVAGQCNFDSLWWLILAFHILLPVCTGIGASFLIPNKNQTEELIISEGNDSERNGVMEMLNVDDDFEMEVDNTL